MNSFIESAGGASALVSDSSSGTSGLQVRVHIENEQKVCSAMNYHQDHPLQRPTEREPLLADLSADPPLRFAQLLKFWIALF